MKLKRITKPLCKAFIAAARKELLGMGAIEEQADNPTFNGGDFYLETRYGLIDFNIHAEPGRISTDIFARFKDPSIARLAGLSVGSTNNKWNHHFERDDIEFAFENERLHMLVGIALAPVNDKLEGITEQWIFNVVSKHLLNQKSKSINCTGHCQYLCVDGKKCAIGCLIPNYLYNPTFEGLAFKDRFITSKYSGMSGSELRLYEFCQVFIKLGYKDEHLKLLNNLQNMHDCYDTIEWEKSLREVAQKRKLTCNF